MPMQANLNAAIHVLSRSVLFSAFAPEEIRELAGYFNPITLPRGQALFHAGDRTGGLYILQEGTLIEPAERPDEEGLRFGPGSLIGEESLYLQPSRQRSILAETDAQLLFMPNSLVQRYLLDDERFSEMLETLSASRTLTESISASWLKPDERLYLVTRQHPVLLGFHSLLPVLSFVLLWLLLGAFPRLPESVVQALLIAGFAACLVWVFWLLQKWAGEYAAVTSQRILRLQRRGRSYMSQTELPLTALAETKVQYNSAGKFWGYAALVLQTYLGDLRFEGLQHPEALGKLALAYAQRERAADPQASALQMHAALNRKIGKPVEELSAAEMETEASRIAAAPEGRSPGLLAWIFSDFLRLRQEADGTTSYRKHWLVLLMHILLPILIIGGAGYLAYLSFTDQFIWMEPSSSLTVAGLSMVGAFVWLVLAYTDWRNDLYQLSDTQVIDLDRNIFGSESNRSAPLENILSVQYKRKGLLGLIFNYGTVFINVGMQDLSFDDVYRPAQVQQEIFARMEERAAAMRRQLGELERQRMGDWFRVYHAELNARSQEGTQPLKPAEP